MRPQSENKLQISREVRDFGELIREEKTSNYRLLQTNSREVMVGATGTTTMKYPTTICKLLFCNYIELKTVSNNFPEPSLYT